MSDDQKMLIGRCRTERLQSLQRNLVWHSTRLEHDRRECLPRHGHIATWRHPRSVGCIFWLKRREQMLGSGWWLPLARFRWCGTHRRAREICWRIRWWGRQHRIFCVAGVARLSLCWGFGTVAIPQCSCLPLGAIVLSGRSKYQLLAAQTSANVVPSLQAHKRRMTSELPCHVQIIWCSDIWWVCRCKLVSPQSSLTYAGGRAVLHHC